MPMNNNRPTAKVDDFYRQPALKGNVRRSRFSRNSICKTMFSAGSLIPVYFDEILPGDIFNMDLNFVARLASAALAPTLDNAFMDFYAFFVPFGQVAGKEAYEVFGTSDSPDEYVKTTEKSFGDIVYDKSVKVADFIGTPLDYLGVPPEMLCTDIKDNIAKGAGIDVKNVLIEPTPVGQKLGLNNAYIRAYRKIWNEYFRDQGTMEAVAINYDLSDDNLSDVNVLLPVAKYHDYFTSALRGQQKGSAPTVSLGGLLPISNLVGFDLSSGKNPASIQIQSDDAKVDPNKWYPLAISSGGLKNMVILDDAKTAGLNVGTFLADNGIGALQKKLGFVGVNTDDNGNALPISVDASSLPGFSISDLRELSIKQRILEAYARGGTRYWEWVQTFFGVVSPELEINRVLYLGGSHQRLSLNQVEQTSATDVSGGKTPLAQVAAYGLTTGQAGLFQHSFTQNGILMICACVRTDQSYQQGVDRQLTHKVRDDFYNPMFEGVSEQPVYNKELVFSYLNKDEVFGFNEFAARYRYKPNVITGALRSSANQSFDIYDYANQFTSVPTLSKEFIQETSVNIDRTIAVSSKVSPQYIVDIAFICDAERPMPRFSTPGVDRI